MARRAVAVPSSKPKHGTHRVRREIRWVCPPHLLPLIQRYAGINARLDGEAEAQYALVQATTELVEMGLAAIPQDQFVYLRLRRYKDQIRTMAVQVMRATGIDFIRSWDAALEELLKMGDDETRTDKPRRAWINVEDKSGPRKKPDTVEAEQIMAQISPTGDGVLFPPEEPPEGALNLEAKEPAWK